MATTDDLTLIRLADLRARFEQARRGEPLNTLPEAIAEAFGAAGGDIPEEGPAPDAGKPPA